MSARDAGKALGGAIVQLRQKVAELEGREPSFNVPVPSVSINTDLAPITEALANPAVAEALSGIADAIGKQSDAEALGKVADALDAVSTQLEQTQMEIKALGNAVTSAMLTPKELFFDDAGDPIGIKPTGSLPKQ